MLVSQHGDDASHYGRSVVDICVGCLAKEVAHRSVLLHNLVDDAAHQHRLPFARIPVDPEQATLWVHVPLPELVVV